MPSEYRTAGSPIAANNIVNAGFIVAATSVAAAANLTETEVFLALAVGNTLAAIYVVSLLPDERNQTLYRVAGSKFKGVFYPTPERAVKSFAKMVEYNRFLKKF